MRKATSHKLLEVACFDVESCFLAEQAGADRVEFCSDYNSGGVTPLWDDIANVKKGLKIPLHVIIRPRAGNFVYSREEMDMMKRAILFCKEHQVDGVVFGVLNSDNTINAEANRELVDLAKPMSLTFHRAIDECADTEEATEKIILLNFDRVLTSGGKQSAIEGIEHLTHLQKLFGEQITLMPGGGVRSSNITQLIEQTGCREFHSAAMINQVINADEIRSLNQKLS